MNDDVTLIADAMFVHRRDHRDVQQALERLGLDGPVLNYAALKAVLRAAKEHPMSPDFDAPGAT